MSLWRYSLRAWRRPGVPEACIGLQESCGADVNLVLFCCWLAEQGRVADPQLLRSACKAVERWQKDVLRPLRSARRAASESTPVPWAARVRERVLHAELAAEHAEQDALVACANAAPRRTGDAAAENLLRYLELIAVPPRAHAPYSGALRTALRIGVANG